MKKNFILLIFFLTLTNLFGQVTHTKLQISHLTGDFYIYTTYRAINGNLFPSNGMYIVSDNGVVIIDSPWDTTQFQPLLDSIKIKHNKKATHCITTHSHEDRTGGLEYFRQQGIKTYSTKHTDDISKEHGEKRAEFILPEDTTFSIGQYSFQIYYAGQGHTPDNIVLWFEKEKILYGGCLIKSAQANDLGYLGDANIKEWIATIQKIKSKFSNPKYIIPGHQDWNDNKSLNHTLYLLKQKGN